MATEVSINDLSTWLSNQPDNTVDTPYEIKITNITSSDHSTLHSALYNNPTKYVDLSETQLSFVLMGLFEQCSSLVESPKLPNSVTSNKDIQSMYYKCTSLRKAPRIPEGVTGMYQCFALCTSLTEIPPLPETVTDLEVAFFSCSLLVYKPIIPNSVTSSRNCYYGVTTNNWKGTQSQAESFLQTFFAQTADSELQIYNNDRVTYDHSIYNIDISNISTAYDFVSGLAQNTPETAYKIYLRGLTSSNAENITRVFGYIYIQTPTKFYDFGYTTIPQGTSLTYLFWRTDGYYMYSCSSMVTAPVLPTDQTAMNRTFSYCFALKNVTIPNGITSLEKTFSDCSSLETIVIPNTVTTMTYTFVNCVSLVDAPEIPSGVTNISGAFSGCTSLTTAPEIPSSVTDISSAFYNCTNITEIQSIPSGITGAESAFEGCTSLRKIDEFNIPLNTLKNNTVFRDMFKDCPSLETIGFKVDTSNDWHVFSLSVGSSSIEGKVYGVNTNKQITTATIPSTSITKSSIRLPVLTDELWFPSGLQASEIEDAIEDMLNYKYGVFNKQVIPPNDKQMVIWADEDSQGNAKVVTNIASGIEVETISTSKTITPVQDKRVIVDTSGITVTLGYGATSGVVTEVYAMQSCTVTYYTAQSTTSSLSMASGSKAVFINYSGWKLHSNYGTTNTVAVDNLQSVSSNAVARAISDSVLISNVLIGTYTLQAGQTISPDITNSIPPVPQGYTRFTQVYGTNQNYLQTSVQFVGNRVYMTATNHHSGALTYDIYTWVMYYKNAQYI